MTTAFAVALADEINQRLDAGAVLDAISFHADKLQEAGTTLKAFCPIHQDSRFRSLLVDAERKAFRCTIKTCRGYSGGSLLELYALSRDTGYLAAACELVGRLGLDLGPDWQDQLVESYLEAASAAVDRSDLTEAETLLRELIGIMPDMADARIMLASVMADLGKPEVAAEEYVRLIDQFVAANQYNEAAAAAEDALRRFPDNEDLLFVRVKVAEQQGDSALAVERMREIVSMREAANRQLDNIGLLEQLVAKVPEEPEFALKLAALYELQHNLRGASRQYENAARQLLNTDKKAEGIELLEKVVQFNSENTRARLDLASELVNVGEIEKARTHTFRVINQQIDQQEFGLAIKTINGWLEREPDNIDARELFARVYLDQAQPSEAAASLVEGAEIASKEENHSRSSELLLRAKFLLPDDTALRHRLIAEFKVMGEHQRAAFEMIDLAEILFSTEQTASAMTVLSEGIAMDISLPLKLQMVSALANHAVTDVALQNLQKLTELLSDDTPPDEVAELKSVMVRLEPDSVIHHVEYIQSLWQVSPERAAETAAESAEFFLARDMAFEAVQVLEKITERLDGYVPATAHLLALAERCDRLDLAGAIYQVSIQGFAEHDPEAALRSARRISELDPSHPSAPSDTAYLLAMLGQTSEAAAQYAQVAELLRLSGDLENALQYAREGAALDAGNVSALACQALVARELLSPEEAAEFAEQLLSATRGAINPADLTAGYLAYAELYEDDQALLKEAADRLKTMDWPVGLARIQARQAAGIAAQGDYDGARRLLDEALEAAPDLPDILEQYGHTVLQLDERDAASTSLARAASLYKAEGFVDAAMRCATHAYEIGPSFLTTWETLFRGAEAAGLPAIAAQCAENLTRAYAETGPQSSAARWAREWVRLSPDDPAAHNFLGAALLAIDQKDNASAALSTAVNLYRDAGDAANSLAVIRRAADAEILTEREYEILAEMAANTTGAIQTDARLLLAIAEVSRGELAAARKLAEDLASEPEAAYAWSLIGKKEPDHAAAGQAFLEAARVLYRYGSNDEAIAELQSAVNLGRPAYDVQYLLATLLHEAKRYDEAFPWQLAIVGQLASEKSNELQPLLEQLRTIHGESIDSLTSLGKTLYASGLVDEALVDLEKAAELASKSNNAAALVTICSIDEELTRRSMVLTRARADSLMGMENVQQALEWVRTSGRELLQSGKAGEAVEMAQRWISLASTDREAHRLYAEACEAVGDNTRATEARLTLARIDFEAGELDQALLEIEPLTQTSSPVPAGLRLKADIHKSKGDSAAAADTLALLGRAYVEAADPDRALAAFQESTALNPGNATALKEQADLLRQTQGLAAAVPVYRQWIELQKQTAQPEEVIGNLQDVLTFSPDSVYVLRNLTDALIANGRHSEADPYLTHLSFVLETEGDYLQSAQALEVVVSHASQADPKQLVAIADLYEKAARLAQAQDHLRHAATLYMEGGNPAEAAMLLERLLKLSGEKTLPEDYALTAKAFAQTGNEAAATDYIGKALGLISRVSGNRSRRETLLAEAMEIAPLNIDYILQHLELLPAGRAMTEGLRKSRDLNASGRPDDAIRILTQIITLAPHDMSLRQELFAPLRATGNTNRLRQELVMLATDAIAAGDPDAAFEALDEATELAQTAAHHRSIAELNERSRRTDAAAASFIAAALKFAEDEKVESAVANINRAVSANPSAVPAEAIAQLVRLLGQPVHDVAREQLRSALTARRQKQSQVLAMALLETVSPERRNEILKTVNTLGGSTFAVGISQRWIEHLLESNEKESAQEFASSLLNIAPDSPDAWQLAAKVYAASGKPADTRRSAIEAARLYQTAGAVIEEEDSYRLALKAEPDNLAVQAALAEYLVRENRQEEAVELLQQVIATAEAAGNTDLLLESLNRAVQVAPANTDLREKMAVQLEKFAPDSAVENWLETAQLYVLQEECDRAARVYKHVLKLNPSNETALQELLTLAEQTNDLIAAARYTSTLAGVKASRKNVGEACRLLQAYLERDSDNLEILEQLASLSGTSNNSEVFAATTQALARKLQRSGKHEEAIHHYELLLERTPKDARLLTALLDCSAAAGLPDKGADYARQLLAVAKETEDPERVRLAAATILNYNDSDASAHFDLGEALLSLNRVTEAVAEWMRAAELFELNENIAAAYTCYRRVTQTNPGTIQAWKRLSDLALTIGDVESARMSVLYVLDKSADKKEAKKNAVLITRLLQALPDDAQVHQAALDFYVGVADTDKAADEYLWLARNAIASGEEQKAEGFLDQGLKLAPVHEQLKLTRYELIRKMGRLEEIQLRLRSEAEKHEEAGETAQAIAVMQELVATAPGQIAVHRDLARLLESAGKFDEALEQHLHVIRVQIQRGEFEEAREVADNLANRHPKDSRARERIADILAESSFPDAAARHYLAAAKIAQSAKDAVRAVELYKRATLARPSWIEARSALAEACEDAGLPDQAFDSWVALTSILLDAGDLSEATATLDRLAQLQPDSPKVREQLAALYDKTGNREKQAEVLQELVTLYESTGCDNEALEVYRKLAAINPKDPSVLTRYVELLTQHGAQDGELAEQYTRLADVLANNEDYEAASQTYEQILGISPENTGARSRYATFLLGRGNRHRAVAEMRTLSTLYIDRGEPAAAVEVLNAALTISPRDADLCLALAAAQEAAGFTEEARISYARASAILASTAAVKGIDTYRRILSQDENNTAVRQRLVELLINSGDKIEAAREARTLAEIHIALGQLTEAEKAYQLVDQCEPESVEEIEASIRRDSYDPSLQYVHYVRLGNLQFDCGDIDKALDAFRTARSLHDDHPDIIQKCIDCVSLIAPEAEAIPDYLLMAEKLMLAGELQEARKAFEQVRLIDPFNNDAKCGLEAINASERTRGSSVPGNDDMILKASRTVSKRVALRDLLVACQEAAQDSPGIDSQRLGG